MNEKLLQFIWQFQHFNTGGLTTVESEPLQVIFAGTSNYNQGPDFLDAKIRIGNTIWAGNVELHIHSSGWIDHKHDRDRNYNNVILHVVWQHDLQTQLPFSTLELHNRVPKLLLHKYNALMDNRGFIACEKNIAAIDHLTLSSMKERLAVERLITKANIIFEYQGNNNRHWQESFWWLLAKNFGARVNAEAFEKTARSIPVSILSKHKTQVIQLEALLFGQSGLLEGEFAEDYPRLLQREYRFLKGKYRLSKINASLMFLRMRPSNFPTVRLAQLAMLVHQSEHLFSKAKETCSLRELKQMLDITANDYWHYHYVFDVPAAFKKKKLGVQMTDNILVNTIIPMVFAYGAYHGDGALKEKALKWLEEVDAEKNSITSGFQKLGLSNATAFDSQAFIQLKHEYCDQKRCLDCSIGNKLMRKND